MQRFLSRRQLLAFLGGTIALSRPTFAASQTSSDMSYGQELQSWFQTRRKSFKPGSNAYQLATTLASAFTNPTDGRHRFVLPRSDSQARRNLPAWSEVFSTASERSQFHAMLNSYLDETSKSLELDKSAAALKIASLAMLLPANEMSPWQTRFPHPSIEAIQKLRRAAPTPKGTHPVTGWSASSYQLAQTPHFNIAIQGRNRPNLDIAEICEQAFAIWTQLFSSVWKGQNQNENSNQATSINPQSWVPRLESPFQVVAFSSKENYIKAIERSVPNASASVGYYNPQVRTAFLFVEPDRNFATLVHELTHQFFAEAISETHFDLNESSGYWLAEGVALYLESLSISDLGSARLIDVGGWDAPRMQASRFRILYEGMWFPWDEFSVADGTRFRDPRELAQRYSQASGITHYLFEGFSQNPQSIYHQIGALYNHLDNTTPQDLSDDELMRGYMEFMRRPQLNAQQYQPFANRNELVLPRCVVDSKELAQILTSRNTWDAIDVAFTKCDDELFLNLSSDLRIGRLNIESTPITDKSLAKIASVDRLQELDLSNCQITNDGIQSLKNHPTLKILWIVDTPADDDIIETIISIQGLHTLHAKGCSISQSGWERLLRAAPKLAKRSTPP